MTYLTDPPKLLSLLVLCVLFVACNDQAATPDLSVSSVTLLDADTGEPVAGFDPLADGANVDLAATPTRNLSVRVDTEPAAVGSVRVSLGETERTLDAAPYTLSYGWTPGDYTLSATPYSGAGASGSAGTPYSVTFRVTDEPVPAEEPAPVEEPANVQHRLYVILTDKIKVYDMDKGYAPLGDLDLPDVDRIWGATAHAASGKLYLSYHDSSEPGYARGILAYDLVNEEVLWTERYEPFVDSLEVTPDGETLYMATGEATEEGDFWFVIDAADGSVEDTIPVYRGAHNTIVSLDGERVYMGSVRYPYLAVADTATNEVIQEVGPFLSGVRPFTVNGAQTLAFVNVNQFLGFEVGDIATGEKLYSVPVEGFRSRKWKGELDVQSHGVALTPDEQEVWVADNGNDHLHIFDVSGLPDAAPVQEESVALDGPPNWIAFSRDGRYAHVSTGDVIDTQTREIVAKTASSKIRLQIDFVDDKPVAAHSRYGLGYVVP